MTFRLLINTKLLKNKDFSFFETLEFTSKYKNRSELMMAFKRYYTQKEAENYDALGKDKNDHQNQKWGFWFWCAFTLCLFKLCYHFDEKERTGCLVFIVFRMYCYCKWYMGLPHGAVGWSAVCDCGIS